MKRIYLDHAATTYLDKRVKTVMEPYWNKNFGNASAIHKEGRDAKIALDNSRKTIADLIGARSDEIIFTSGGTEGNNLAIFGVLNDLETPFPSQLGNGVSKLKAHIITSNIEHHSVLRPIEELEKSGRAEATFVKIEKNGIVNSKNIANALKPNTILVSIMYANNEIGTIQPISEISRVIGNFRDRQILNSKSSSRTKNFGAGQEILNKFKIQNSKFKIPFFHSDACQAGEYLDMNVQKLGCDIMTVNGSKIYGPKGVGFLYVKKGVPLKPLIYGGGQEIGLRSGTENIPAIVGLAEAFKIARAKSQKESGRLIQLRDYLIDAILKIIPNAILNGDPTKRLPNNVNVSILNAEGEAMVLYLDEKGIACSTGSACASESLDPSHVIMALGRRYEYAHGSLRFSLGRRTTKKEIDHLLKFLPPIVEKLRQMSPVKFQTNHS